MPLTGRFELDDDRTTIIAAIEHGWFVEIRCDGCDRSSHWTSRDMARRFRDALDAKLAVVGERLRCAECGSREGRMVLFQGDHALGAGGYDVETRRRLRLAELMADL